MEKSNVQLREYRDHGIEVTAWRDQADGYYDGVVISGIYGDISPDEAAEIQYVMNDERTRIKIPVDPIGGLVGVVCDVWFDIDGETWIYKVNHLIVADNTTHDTVMYPCVVCYEDAEAEQYIKKMREVNIDRMFVADRADSFVVELGKGLDIMFHEYKGIKFMTHRDLFRDKTKWCVTERVSGSTIPNGGTFPDEVRAEAAFRDMVDKMGVLRVCHDIMKAYRSIEKAKLISIDEYKKLVGGKE